MYNVRIITKSVASAEFIDRLEGLCLYGNHQLRREGRNEFAIVERSCRMNTDPANINPKAVADLMESLADEGFSEDVILNITASPY